MTYFGNVNKTISLNILMVLATPIYVKGIFVSVFFLKYTLHNLCVGNKTKTNKSDITHWLNGATFFLLITV